MRMKITSAYDAKFLHELRDFPHELQDELLVTDVFREHFKSFDGRSVQDVVDALRDYAQAGYLTANVILSPKYLKQGLTPALTRVEEALRSLQPESKIEPNGYHGLSRRLYAKVVRAEPLNDGEVRNLPDKAKPYLVFQLSDIDGSRLDDELAIYDDNTLKNIHPSRLVKVTELIKPATNQPAMQPVLGDSAVAAKEPVTNPKLDKINYDKDAQQLTYGNKILPIQGALNCEVCRQVFKNRRKAAFCNDILDAVDENKQSRAVYDATSRINKKIEAKFNISNVLESKDEKVRISKKYI
jgi:hypothetical protein